MRTLPILLLLLAASACTAAPNETVSGRVKVTDGDSFTIGEQRIRLHAVDAPEGRQTCNRSGEVWACGEAAASKLRELVAGRTVTCTREDEDSYGRLVAVCSNGSTDLGRAMVSAGFALAYRQYGNDYVAEENTARAARRGIWAGDFTAPADFRRGESGNRNAAPRDDRPAPRTMPKPTPPSETRRSGCNIKGNVSDNGKIYHVPGSARYDETQIDERKGERWFCSESEARAAGWREPRG